MGAHIDGFIAVVAGFQGVNDKGDIRTLGRGGSDTSAVALASALGAEKDEIFSDDENEGQNQYDSSDYEDYGESWENYSKKWYRELGKNTFLPGLAIISIGYVGQKIKLGMVGGGQGAFIGAVHRIASRICLLYTSDAADE